MAIKITGRSLNIPISDRIVGHEGDNLIETRTFELNRYYSNIDMSVFDFKLDTQVGDVKNTIDLDKTVSEDKIILTWNIAESHLLHSGYMSIQLRAFSGNEEKWHSAQDYVQVQPSINATEVQPSPLPSEFEQIEQRVTAAKNEAIEAAQEAKQQAERVEDIIQEAEQDVLPELRQAIEDGIETKDQLGGSIHEAGEAKTALDGSISAAGEAKTGLEGTITQANIVKGQLDGSITQAGTKKTELDGSITAAGQVKEALDESIATGDLAAFRAEFESHKNDYATYKDSNNLKVAKVEKDLNDYQKTLSQVNVNQEAKQKVSGHGTISLPKNAANGQVNAVIQGNTRTNLVKNGNLELGTTEHWGSSIVIENGWFRSTGTTVERNNQIVKVKPNTTYTLSVLSYSRGLETGVSYVYYRFKDQDGNALGLATPISGKNTAPQKYSKTVTTTETTAYIEIYSLSGSENWCYFKEVMIEEGDKLNPYISGTKSTVSAFRIKSVNENLFDNEDNYSYNGSNTTHVYNNGVLTVSTTDEVTPYRAAAKILKIKKGVNYTFSCKSDSTGTGGGISIYPVDKQGNNVGSAFVYYPEVKNPTYTIVNNISNYIKIIFYASGNTAGAYTSSFWDIKLEEGDTATEYTPHQENEAYITAKDEEGNIIKIHSLPNGVRDRIYQAEDGQWYVEKNIKEYILQESDILYFNVARDNFDSANIQKPDDMAEFTMNSSGQAILEGYNTGIGANQFNFDSPDYVNSIIASKSITGNYLVVTLKKGKYSSLGEVRADLAGTQLIYQLATPIEIPIQTSGSLVSYPSGTVYIELFVADAGIYTDKLTVLHHDLPIKRIEKLSKIDFLTGVETELDASQAVIAEDKLSFTHPGLVAGDIVFFTYEYNKEGTIPEAEIEYYDSRVVVQDSVNGKFYKWAVAVANGVPSITLTEV